MTTTTLQLKLSSSYITDNLKQIEQVAYDGLLGKGKPVIYSHYDFSTDNRETRFTRVLSFDQTKETPSIVENIGASYYLLEVNKEISWYDCLLLVTEIFKKGKSLPELISLAASIKHENPEVSLVASALERAKGKVIGSASCSHHSGEEDLDIISLGKKGVAVCLTTEKVEADDWEKPSSSVYKYCDGNLYNLINLDLNPSVKSNSEIKGEIIRKLTEEEKTFLKEVYSSDLEFED